MIGNIPVFDALLGEDCGMIRISLVDRPAVMKDFIALRERDAFSEQRFSVQDEEKRLVRGVVMRAGFPILREAADKSLYYVVYSSDTIRQMAQQYLAEGRANKVDTGHNHDEVEGVEMVQFFIKDSAAGIVPAGFEDISDGSLFAEFHVTNDDVWQAVKDGTFKGFSLEGVFNIVETPENDQETIDKIVRSLDGMFQIFSSNDMSKIAKIKAALAKLLVELRNVTTDKGVIYWDGDEDLKAGDAVYTGEDADRIPAVDGDYVTSDGKTIRVKDGTVEEIVDPDAEVEGNDDANDTTAIEAARSIRGKIRALMEESFDEKSRKIAEAIFAVLPNDRKEGFLREAGEDYGVWQYWGEDYIDHFVRYAISWDEEGNATASDPVDVELRFVPVDKTDEVEKITEEEFAAAVKAAQKLATERDALKARVAELESKPAAKSAHEAFVAADGKVSTGDKGLDALARRFRK